MPASSKEKQATAWAKWYAVPENKAKHIAAVTARNASQREKIKDTARAAKSVPCADCNTQYPFYVMQFDHVRGEKLFTIGEAVRSYVTLEKLLAEIAKCEVVCANCHAERSWQRLPDKLLAETIQTT